MSLPHAASEDAIVLAGEILQEVKEQMAAMNNTSKTDACLFEPPAGSPRWVTSELIANTIRTWQPYYRKPLTPEDALEMLLNVGHLLDILHRSDT